MKETTEEYIAKLKTGLATLETALYEAKMSAQEVNTRKNKQIAEQQAEINRLKSLCISYIDDEWSGTSSYQAKIDEVNNERT